MRRLLKDPTNAYDHRFYVGVDSSRYRVRAPSGGALLKVSYKAGTSRPLTNLSTAIGSNIGSADVFDFELDTNGALYAATNSTIAATNQIKKFNVANGEITPDRGCKFSLGTTGINPNVIDFGLAVSPQCQEIVANMVDAPTEAFCHLRNLTGPRRPDGGDCTKLLLGKSPVDSRQSAPIFRSLKVWALPPADLGKGSGQP